MVAHPIRVSFFENVRSSEPVDVSTTWPKLVSRLSNFTMTDDKATVPLWSPCVYKSGSRRAKQNVELVTALVWDYDSGVTIEDALAPWLTRPLAFHTTHSHTDAHHKFRVIIPLAEPVKAENWARCWDKWAEDCSAPPDPACKDPSRMYYLPSAPIGQTEYFADGYDFSTAGYLRADPFIWERPERPKYQPRTDYIARARMSGSRGYDPALMESDEARGQHAEAIGAAISGDRAHGIRCPKCDRPSAFFFIAVGGALKTARCNHAKSCGWYGHIGELT